MVRVNSQNGDGAGSWVGEMKKTNDSHDALPLNLRQCFPQGDKRPQTLRALSAHKPSRCPFVMSSSATQDRVAGGLRPRHLEVDHEPAVQILLIRSLGTTPNSGKTLSE